MDHVERCCVTDHHPQPLELVRQKPGRLIDVVDRGVARLRGNRQVVRLDGLGHAVEHLLDRSQADGHLQHRRTKGLHDPPPVAVGPGYFAHEGTEAWAIPRGMLGGHVGFTPTPAVRTPALMQHPVGHVQRNRRQLQHLSVWYGLVRQTSCCHTHTARAAAPGLSWGARAPGDGPDSPVYHPLCEAWWRSYLARLLVGESDDGGPWEVVESWWRRASNAVTRSWRAWSCARSSCTVRRYAWTAVACAPSPGAKREKAKRSCRG